APRIAYRIAGDAGAGGDGGDLLHLVDDVVVRRGGGAGDPGEELLLVGAAHPHAEDPEAANVEERGREVGVLAQHRVDERDVGGGDLGVCRLVGRDHEALDTVEPRA